MASLATLLTGWLTMRVGLEIAVGVTPYLNALPPCGLPPPFCSPSQLSTPPPSLQGAPAGRWQADTPGLW